MQRKWSPVLRRVPALAAGVLLLVCATVSAEPLRKGTDGRADAGAVRIFEYRGNTVIAMDSAAGGTDGLVDQWYVLQRPLPSELVLPIYIAAADVRYRGGALRVSAPGGRVVYDFVVTGYDSSWAEPEGVTIIATEGLGLSRNVAKTDVPLLPAKASGSMSVATDDETCPGCEIYYDDMGGGGGGGGGTTCDAGGILSSSCSYSDGTHSCAITCNGNVSYSCCRRTSTGVKCSCVPY